VLLKPARFAIWANDARGYPSSAIVSIAAVMICARRACSVREGRVR
jgi:hypothetical protein